MQTLLEAENLTKHFSRRSGMWSRAEGTVRAVDGVSFDIGENETLGLVGESGSGKSTTGRLLLRLIEPTGGVCRFRGRNVYDLSASQMRALRREMQIVFQDPYGAFNPRMTVGRILGEALELRGVRSARARTAEAGRLLELVHMPAAVQSRYPHEFSGGQRQRIGIARALAVEPRFLVADEPVSALDVSTQAEIVNLLLELRSELGLTMLFISHDLSVVRVLAQRVAVMFAGKILEMGSTGGIFRQPLQPYTQELLAAIPIPDPKRAQRTPRPKRSEETGAPAAAAQGCPYAGRCPYTMDVCRREMPALVDYSAWTGESQPHWAACHWTEQQSAEAAVAATPPKETNR